MKVVFLDIDGVLNVFNDGSDSLGHLFNMEFLNNLKKLVVATQAKIVVSSNWKHLLVKINEAREYGLDIHDKTPDLFDVTDPLLRSKEIDAWLAKHPEIEKYVILDDMQQFDKHHQKHFVKTSGNFFHPQAYNGYGFTEQCLEKAIRLLS